MHTWGTIEGHGYRQAMRHYRRLQADTESWAYNAESALDILRDGLRDAPIMRHILELLAHDAKTPAELGDEFGMPPWRSPERGHSLATLLIRLFEDGLVDRERVVLRGPVYGRTYRYRLSALGQRVMGCAEASGEVWTQEEIDAAQREGERLGTVLGWL